MAAKIKIHFVCRGNFYRSRLAEIYAKAQFGHLYDFSSSGVDHNYPPDGLSYQVGVVCQERGYDISLSPLGRRLEQSIVDESDVLIFLDAPIYHDAKSRLKINADKVLIWRVKDWDEIAPPGTAADSPLALKLAFECTDLLAAQIDKLVAGFLGKSWCDVVDEHNQPLGYRLPIDWITDRGRWHRGVRVILRSPDGNYLLEKRSNTIVYAPDMLDFSMGGLIDAGETPLQAARRELAEELGINLKSADLRYLADIKWQSYHPSLRKHSRVFLTCYVVTVPEDIKLKLQPEEVAAAYWMSRRQVRRLIRQRSLRHFGRLMYGYRHWWQLINQVESAAKP